MTESRGSRGIVTLGEALICLTPTSGRLGVAKHLRKSMGGAEANTAIGLARLGHPVTMVTRVGADPFGEQVLRTLHGEGVDVSAADLSSSAPTAVMFKDVRGHDDISVYYYRDGSAAREITEAHVDEDLIANAARVHLGGIALALSEGMQAALNKIVSVCKANDVPVSFDPNYRHSLWPLDRAVAAYREVLPDVADLLLNEFEARAITGEPDVRTAGQLLAATGGGRVVIKRGAAGVMAWDGDGSVASYPARSDLVVVDSVGGGDAFNAGYLHGVLSDVPFATAVQWGVLVAGRVVAAYGDYEGLPFRHEFEREARLQRAAGR